MANGDLSPPWEAIAGILTPVMNERPIAALFLDFDGTILDTETVEYLAWQEVYHYYGQELLLPLWADSIGRGANDVKFDPYVDLEARVGKPLDDEIVRVRRRARRLEMFEAEPIRPGITSYLTEAHRLQIPVAVVSSSEHDWVDGHLRRLGLFEAMAFTRCFGDVPLAKPHPDLYLSACATLGLRPEATVAIEDSPNGLKAANRAGIFAVAFPNPLTALLDLSHADLRIDDLTQVPFPQLLQTIAQTPRQNTPRTIHETL